MPGDIYKDLLCQVHNLLTISKGPKYTLPSLSNSNLLDIYISKNYDFGKVFLH